MIEKILLEVSLFIYKHVNEHIGLKIRGFLVERYWKTHDELTFEINEKGQFIHIKGGTEHGKDSN